MPEIKTKLNIKDENWKIVFGNEPENSAPYQIMNYLLGNSEGYFYLARRGRQYSHKAYHTTVLKNPNMLANIIGSNRFGINNLCMSLCTYYDDSSRCEDNILSVAGIVSDIDLDKSLKYCNMPSAEALMILRGQMEDAGIPISSVDEIGRNIRAIWIFEKPFILPKDMPASKRKACITFLKRLGKTLNNKIAALDDWGVDDFKLNPLVRVPMSINKHYTEYFDEKGRRRFHCDGQYRITHIEPNEILKEYSKVDFQRFADTILDLVPDWYNEWKEKPHKKTGSSTPVEYKENDLTALCKRRINDLLELQRRGYGVGYRETMCWLYSEMYHQMGYEYKEYYALTKEFNNRFEKPLHPTGLKCAVAKPEKFYKLKDKTIREKLCLDADEQPDLFCGKSRKERYRAKLEDGKYKAEKIAETCLTITELMAEGKSNKEIEELLCLPHSTYQRYKTFIKNGIGKIDKEIQNIVSGKQEENEIIQSSKKANSRTTSDKDNSFETNTKSSNKDNLIKPLPKTNDIEVSSKVDIEKFKMNDHTLLYLINLIYNSLLEKRISFSADIHYTYSDKKWTFLERSTSREFCLSLLSVFKQMIESAIALKILR